MKNNFYINKWTKLGLCALASLMLGSCVDLDEDPSAVQLDPTALSSDAALEGLVAGMYRKIHSDARWSAFFIGAYGGDDITTSLHDGDNKVGFRDSDLRKQTASSERLDNAYNGCYASIANANTAIDAAEQVNGDPEIIDRLLGEAYFMRAFNYLFLTRTYGRVVLQLKSNSNEKLALASFDEIYAQIESDLKNAEELLPNVYPGIETTGIRASKGTAKAFLARLYMHWAGYPIKDASKYALAATKAKEVIDGDYGYALAEDFRSMWTESGRFGHTEGVFTIVSCRDCKDGSNRSTGKLGLPGELGGWSETFGEIAFFDDFEATATTEGTMKRFEGSYILEDINLKDTLNGADWRNWVDKQPALLKVVGGDVTNETKAVAGDSNNDINRYFMRYADVLLMYAEASGRSGSSPADAWEAMNMVRRRAAGLPIDTPDASIDLTAGDLAELAFTERKWEFAGEYQRWYDLVRMERVVDALANRSDEEPVIGDPRTSGEFLYFSPIPASQLSSIAE
ncbi:MAG: RagB/SusD family nutrient uptake outer membrane protein [Reichenbachiella sp.]|uniref:RagB/SusD family nutrient uptake outer membrane protein n=1 Tax=Reichenbachiella sp. TaxID=2184521 RepID=UPI0032972CE5